MFCRVKPLICDRNVTQNHEPRVSENIWIMYILSYITIINHLHHQNVLPKDRSFTVNSGTKAVVLPKDRSSTANSGTKVSVLLGMYRCGSFTLLSAPHSLFSIWTDLKRSEKIPGWIWLTGPTRLHRNSPQWLNIISIRVFDQIRDPEIPITLHNATQNL